MTQNAEDNNASTLIILDEPGYEEYKIVNETKREIEYCKQDQAGHELSAWISVPAKGKLDSREGAGQDNGVG